MVHIVKWCLSYTPTEAVLGDVQCIEIDLLQNKLHNYFRSSGLSPYYMADIGIKHKTVLTSFCNKEEANTEPVVEISPVQEHSVICQSTNLAVSEEVRYFLPISRQRIRCSKCEAGQTVRETHPMQVIWVNTAYGAGLLSKQSLYKKDWLRALWCSSTAK